MWMKVVWIEGNKEVEGTVPDSWVMKNILWWPPGLNAEKYLKERKEPSEKWRKFPNIKIKTRSEDFDTCEAYDLTTTNDATDDSDEEITKRKRHPKKKSFGDFVIDTVGSSSEILMDAPNATPKDSQKSGDKPAPIPVPPKKNASVQNQSGSKSITRKSTQSISLSRTPLRSERSRSSSRTQQSQRRSGSRTPHRSRSRSRSLRSQSRSRRSRSRSHRSRRQSRSFRSRSQSRSHRSRRQSRSFRSRSQSRSRRSKSRSFRSRSQSRSHRSRRSKSRSCRSRSQSRLLQSRSQSRSHRSRSQSRSSRSQSRLSRSRSPSPLPTLAQASSSTRQNINQDDDVFPISNAKFQKKVLRLLLDTRKDIKALMESREPEPEFELKQAETVQELEEVEVRIKDLEKKTAAGRPERPENNVGLSRMSEYSGFFARIGIFRDQKNVSVKAGCQIKQVNKLSSIGGVALKDGVRSILKRLMTNEVMSKYNMKGNRGKRAFGSLQLCRVITEIAAKCFKATEHEAVCIIAVALKYAPDRQGGGGRASDQQEGGGRAPGGIGGGGCAPARQDIGGRTPARQDIGGRTPARQDDGGRAPARQDDGGRAPDRQDGGGRAPVKNN